MVGALLATVCIGLVTVGRLQDLQYAATQASRYAAFALAEAPAPANFESALRARFFTGRPAAIRADDREAGTAWRDANPHWVAWAGTRAPLVARPDDVALATTDAAPPGRAVAAMAQVATLIAATARLTGGTLDLDRRGFHAATVTVNLAPLAPFRELAAQRGLRLTERTSVLGDAWNAGDPGHVAARTAALVPAARLRALRPLFDGLEVALALIEPSFGTLCLGRIDPEVVPLDRLGAPGSSDRGTWVAPC